MDPFTAGLILNAGGLIASQIQKRPKYKIPDSAIQALSRAKIEADDPYAPGQQRQMDAAQLATANALRTAQESGNALEGVASIQGQENRAMQDIFTKAEVSQDADEQQLMQLLMQMGQYEDLEFQMNEFAPFSDRQREMRDILGAFTQNLFNKQQAGQLKELLGTKKENPLKGVDVGALASLLLP